MTCQALNTSRSGGRAWWIDKACGTDALIRPADLVNLEGLLTLCHVMHVSKIIPQGLCCGTCSGPMLWDVFGAHVVG